MFRRTLFTVGMIAMIIAARPASLWAACPFCTAVAQTFGEEMGSMEVVVLAELIDKAKGATDDEGYAVEVSKAKFRVKQVIKGEALIQVDQVVETTYIGETKVGDAFLIMGVEPPEINWSMPLKMTERACKYVSHIPSLPLGGADRLAFFQQHLEDEDEMLARDAYDEFAKAPYQDVKDLKDRMNHPQLIAWIKDPDVSSSRKRLYLTMLGVCGGEDDLPMLEELMKSDDRKKKSGLDAMIACYLTLRGADGMPLIEDLFLKNKESEYADTYAAIAALRFHGTEGGVIPRERIVKGLEHMLERPRLADLVIPDLARWEDWEVMDRMVRLFKEADKKTSWVRVPVINYLRACPLAEAKEHIKELEKIDPEAVKQANTFFPLDFDDDDDDFDDDDDGDADDKAQDKNGSAGDGTSKSGQQSATVSANQSLVPPAVEGATRFVSIPKPVPAINEYHKPAIPDPQPTESATTQPVVAEVTGTPGLAMTMGIPFLICLGLFGLIWSVLTGNLIRVSS